MNYRLYCLILLFISFSSSYGQFLDEPILDVDVEFSGPNTAAFGDQDTYTVSVGGGNLQSTSYSVSGGTKISQTNTSLRVQWTDAGNHYVSANVLVNGTYYTRRIDVYVAPPPAPPVPWSPTVSSNTCGNKTLTRGNPPAGVTWYWQTSSGGTSTAHASYTYNVPSSRTVFLRARRNDYNIWSSARSIGVTVHHYPSAPGIPAISTNSCGAKTLTRGHPPSGTTWYWQGTNPNGYSTANASATYPVHVSGTYYLRARTHAGCWSSSRAVGVTIHQLPATPPLPVSVQSCGVTTLSRSNPPAGVTSYWQTSAAGTSLSNANATYTSTQSGTIYLRNRNNSTGCWGGTQQVSYQVISNPTQPPAPAISYQCGTTVLTFGTPPAGVTFYWQHSAEGTATTQASSSYHSFASGTVFLRARNNSTGCWSSSRPVTHTVQQVPTVPSAPTAVRNCGSTVLTRATPPSGTTWYWQTTLQGTSTHHASAAYPLTSSQTVYLRARSASGCWSAALAVDATVNSVPSMPDLQEVDYQYDRVRLTRNEPPQGVSWYWQTDENGTDEQNNSSTFEVSVPGTHYLRGKSKEGCWGAPRAFDLVAEEPQLFSAATLSDESILLTWNAVKGNETGFQISRATDRDGPFQPVYLADPWESNYFDKGLLATTTYYYRIQALVDAQYSLARRVISGKTSVAFQGDTDLAHKPTYNGNTSAIKWRGVAQEDEQIYTYHYDGINRLINAQYGVKALNTYVKNRGHYAVPLISYDRNGNIERLTRQGRNEEGNMDIIDDLIYNYGNEIEKSNRLLSVSDSKGAAGFKDGNKTEEKDYAYDRNGNLTQDLNKGIINIGYNHLNLPERVTFENGDSIGYLYNAAGIKLSQTNYEGGIKVKTTDYVGEFIYEDNHDGAGRQLQLIQHEEGRVVPKDDGKFDYQYNLTDHLGNVRVTFSTTPENYTMVEDFEDTESDFTDLKRLNRSNANSTEAGTYVSAVGIQQTSTMVLVGMNKGDTVNLSVQANYENDPGGNTFLPIAFSALHRSFDGAYGGAEGIISTASEFDKALFGLNAAGKGNASEAPSAFINFLFFDKDMEYKAAGFKQISTAALGVGVHELVQLDAPFVADQEGYLIAYLSNENQEDATVFFDDFTVYHGKTNVVSSSDYYPGGAGFNEYKRTASKDQNFKFNQGTGDKKFLTERIPELQVDMTKYRMYDYWTLRFLQVDPKADLAPQESWTPYHYAFNNPIRYNDPYGDCPTCGPSLIPVITTTIAKYSGIISKGRAPAQRLLTGTSGNVPSNMDSRTRSTMKIAGTANDVNQVAETGKELAIEVTKDTGEVLDKTGEAISDAGLVAAPFTEGASLALVPLGEGMSVTGKVMKAGANLAEGNVEGATKEAVNLAVGAVTNTATGAAIKQSKKVGLITNATEEVAQKTAVGATGSVTNKSAGVVVNKTIDDEQN